MNIDTLLDRGWLPRPLIRLGIRRQLEIRLREIASADRAAATARTQDYVALLRSRPIAVATDTANAQHYEVGTGVLAATLGPYMKYSSCLYPELDEVKPSWSSWLRPTTTTKKKTDLAGAEVAMLSSYIDKAGLKDGMRILDLGCGWGSCSLFLAERLPKAQITAFSNSRTQKTYIDAQAQARGLANLTVITGNVVDYEFPPASFDRVVSIELFEHMKNYELLMAKIARALRPGGKLFVHIFAHATTPYDYEDGWMTTHFFTGGTMPSADLLHYFQCDLALERQWWVNGRHYAQTCEAWLQNMLAHRAAMWPDLVATYGGAAQAAVWYNRWQVFYMACAELFNYRGGDTWGVAHYLFAKPGGGGDDGDDDKEEGRDKVRADHEEQTTPPSPVRK
ncbi:cyclopropane-fatty-acyl-phospholipid synthase [Niveomyces insectorum RCEF 264]|uniref:Cyclopropane-fatty-acyl-phospholipid synthase n=1 Tax=Niveomyces insectorum RCEF 264 TaxID=1081102 RepID=A0A167X790_9HYPO|nr:cyclopropane-fatty-acyl-phospholipid synthase [Niveomyces insectorum RCEF 264]